MAMSRSLGGLRGYTDHDAPASAPEAAARFVPRDGWPLWVGEGEANASEPAQHTGGGTRALPGLPGPGDLRPTGQLVLEGPRATRAAQQRRNAPLQDGIRYGGHEIARVVQAHARDDRRHAHVALLHGDGGATARRDLGRREHLPTQAIKVLRGRRHAECRVNQRPQIELWFHAGQVVGAGDVDIDQMGYCTTCIRASSQQYTAAGEGRLSHYTRPELPQSGALSSGGEPAGSWAGARAGSCSPASAGRNSATRRPGAGSI